MKAAIVFILAIGFAGILAISSSCNYDYFEPVVVIIPDTVSFSQDIMPIFDESCNTSGCHVSGGVSPDLTLASAWFELWIFGYIDTANATSSGLYQVMNSESDPMPPNGKLPEDKVQLVLAWIEQGALDN
ncbi:MAG: hypothetical protein HKN92_01635 [Chitinophagales bacterium]|nr:hypothetical protein [Chitinophagales bacterium]